MTASAAQTTPEDGAGPQGNLAQKMKHLLNTVHPKGREPYSLREAAALINEAARDEVISHSYLGQLRSGKRDNPTMKQLAVFSAFFGVPVWYFFDDEASQRSAQEVELAGLDVPQFGMLAYPEDAVEMLTAGSQAPQRGV